MRILILIVLLAVFTNTSFSCTTFVLKSDASLVFGRNLDWVSDNGVIVVNKSNVRKSSIVFPPEKTTQWVSKYGSITFNQFGKEFPFGGMNEKGLVVELMLISGEYPKLDDRTAINELQWVQYQLDNAASVDEVLASDEHIRISKINQALHFLVCDKNGNTVVIEFDQNGMNFYKDETLPYKTLENDLYETSLNKKVATTRFNTVNKMIQQYDSSTSPVDYSFEILDKVALSGSWSIVYDINNLTISFKTASHRERRSLALSYFNFQCTSPILLYDMKLTDKGNINSSFVRYNESLNKRKFMAAIKSNGIQLPSYILNQFSHYNSRCHCQSSTNLQRPKKKTPSRK